MFAWHSCFGRATCWPSWQVLHQVGSLCLCHCLCCLLAASPFDFWILYAIIRAHIPWHISAAYCRNVQAIPAGQQDVNFILKALPSPLPLSLVLSPSLAQLSHMTSLAASYFHLCCPLNEICTDREQCVLCDIAAQMSQGAPRTEHTASNQSQTNSKLPLVIFRRLWPQLSWPFSRLALHLWLHFLLRHSLRL